MKTEKEIRERIWSHEQIINDFLIRGNSEMELIYRRLQSELRWVIEEK
jgi:hypothetical protein